VATIVNTKLGETKGLKRVWLQGEKLAREGYKPGDRLNVRVVEESLVVESCPTGKYTVSRKKKHLGLYQPVIDLTAAELTQLFQGVEKLRVAIKRGTICISAHHQQARINEREEKLINKLQKNGALDVVSLFHGGGILDRSLHDGYQRAGIKTRLAMVSEINKTYLDCSMRNNKAIWDEHTIAIEGPLQDVDLRGVNWTASMVVAGLPCLGASKSGRSKGKLQYAESHPEAGALFFNTLEVIKTFNPAMLWLEQVPEYLNTASWQVVKSVLGSLGYRLEVTVMDGFEMGALEKRRRMVCLGVSQGLVTGFDINKIKPIRKREACIGSILEDISGDSPQWKPFKYLADKSVRDEKDKKGFRRQMLTPMSTHCGTIGRLYSKFRSTEPFVLHPTDKNKSRIFTSNEHARVKTIDPELVADESETNANEILGQSVIKCVFEAASAAHGESLSSEFGRSSALIAV